MQLVYTIIAVVVATVVASLVTNKVTISKLKNDADSKLGNAEAKAREIIDDAIKTAEATKKESLLEVKEESIKAKNELEKETKERREFECLFTRYELGCDLITYENASELGCMVAHDLLDEFGEDEFSEDEFSEDE